MRQGRSAIFLVGGPGVEVTGGGVAGAFGVKGDGQ